MTDTANLADLRMPALRELAKTAGIKAPVGTSADDLRAALSAHDATPAATPAAETPATQERAEQPAAAATPPTGQPAPADGKVTITRQSDRVWWCPICDFSQPQSHTTCGGCGAERDGDEVTPHADR